MESRTSTILDGFVSQLYAAIPQAEDVVGVLERAGLELTRVEAGRGGPAEDQASSPRQPWLLFFKPPERLATQFDLAPEFLVLIAPGREAQARDIDAAEHVIVRDRRLDRGVVLAVCQDPNASKRVSKSTEGTGRTYITLTFDEVLEVTDPHRWLRELLISRLRKAALFDWGVPVLGWHFTGRAGELKQIRGRLLAGTPVGLFGMSKIGKTSLMLALRDQLIQDSSPTENVIVALPVHLDLLSVSFAESNRVGIMRAMLRSIKDSIRRIDHSPAQMGLPPVLGSDARIRNLPERNVESTAAACLEGLVDWAIAHPSEPRVLLFLDEYEKLLGSGSSIQRHDGLGVLDFLRGLLQRSSRTFNFLIAGRSHDLARQPRFDGRQNPLFNLLSDFPLKGLDSQEMRELLRKIGSRLLVQFQPRALDRVWQETGGHPYLARMYGKAIQQGVSGKSDQVVDATEHHADAFLEPFMRSIAPSMEEMYSVASEVHQDAPSVLEWLCSEADEATALFDDLPHEARTELDRLGIVDCAPDAPPRLRIGCFGRWLVENGPRRSVAASAG